ncbi:MAG: hypothetical protein L0H59_17890 [Tomitella sp.]|nr:hypothetical protein [Tomitella sp.]
MSTRTDGQARSAAANTGGTAGIVRARDAETPASLDALFATPTAPFAGVMF